MVAESSYTDVDPQETREWIESLHSLLDRDGVERTHFILEILRDEARRAGTNLPYSATTAYLNTIPASREISAPGELQVERRIRAIFAGTRSRWW